MPLSYWYMEQCFLSKLGSFCVQVYRSWDLPWPLFPAQVWPWLHMIPHMVRLSQRTAVHQPSWLDTISITQVKALAWALINETTKIKLERLQTFHMNLLVQKINIRISVLFWVCLRSRILGYFIVWCHRKSILSISLLWRALALFLGAQALLCLTEEMSDVSSSSRSLKNVQLCSMCYAREISVV